MASCNLNFENNPLRIVYSGQKLRGQISLNITEEKIVRGIYIKFNGEAKVKVDSVKNKKKYLKAKIFLIGDQNGEVRLSVGSHEYQFEFLLPYELPTSFEGKYGKIHYSAIVGLDVSMRNDTKFEFPFRVIRPINLNYDENLNEPVNLMENTAFFLFGILCCFKTDPVELAARLPVTGFIPGQTINLQFDAKNNSDRPILHFNVQLRKNVQYVAKNGCKKYKDFEIINVYEEKLDGCDKNCENTYQVNITIPPIQPTDDTICRLIKVFYSVIVVGVVRGFHIYPSVEIPIVIGSYPIVSNPIERPLNPIASIDDVPMSISTIDEGVENESCTRWDE